MKSGTIIYLISANLIKNRKISYIRSKGKDMRITVLSDNRAYQNMLETEHGLSILIEHNSYKILCDTGTSDLFLHNAKTLHIDLSDLDYIFLSHGHYDHTGGLKYILALNKKAKIIVSEFALTEQFYSMRKGLHTITTTWPIEEMKDRLIPISNNCTIASDIEILAKFSKQYPTPKGNCNLYTLGNSNEYQLDSFNHEIALFIDGILFSGCAHNGIENIISTCNKKINTVIGGFHLLDSSDSEPFESPEEIITIATTLKTKYPNTIFYTGHCTGDQSFKIMKSIMGEQLRLFYVGMIVDL